VPIVALAGMLTNTGRTLAFLRFVDWHRVRLVMIGAIPPCLVTAYGFTLLTGKGAQLVIGTMLMLTVPLRYTLRRRAVVLHNRGLVLGAAGYGAAVGGTVPTLFVPASTTMIFGLTPSSSPCSSRQRMCCVLSPPHPKSAAFQPKKFCVQFARRSG